MGIVFFLFDLGFAIVSNFPFTPLCTEWKKRFL